MIVLEQKHPLKYQGVPADMEAASNEGRTAFVEDLTIRPARPAAEGLLHLGPDEIVYRNAYVKPTRGGKSLVQCHEKLQNSRPGRGAGRQTALLLLCQLVVGEKLDSNAVAQQLLLNLLDHAASYKLDVPHRRSPAIDGDPPLAKVARRHWPATHEGRRSAASHGTPGSEDRHRRAQRRPT